MGLVRLPPAQGRAGGFIEGAHVLSVVDDRTGLDAAGFADGDGATALDPDVDFPLVSGGEGEFAAYYPSGRYVITFDAADDSYENPSTWDAASGSDLQILVRRTANPASSDFGGVGDGETQDVDAVNAAIDYLKNTFGYGTVEITEPHAIRDMQTVNLQSAITLKCIGRGRLVRKGTFLKATFGRFINGPLGLLANVDFEQMVVDGNMDEIIPTFAGGSCVGPGTLGAAGKSITATGSTDRINCTAHGWTEGLILKFDDVGTTGLTANLAYYVRNPTANNFQVALTAGGTVVGINDSGSGTTSSESHTDGQAPGVIIVDGVTGTFGVPDAASFGVMVINGYVIRYEGYSQVGDVVTFIGCFGGTGAFSDNATVEEHPGNMRMPCINIGNAGGRNIRLHGGFYNDFPGQLFNPRNIDGFEIEGLKHVGSRGLVLREGMTNGRVVNVDITAIDDCVALLAASALGATGITLDDLRLTTSPSNFVDLDPNPEHAGNGLVIMGGKQIQVGTVVHNGAASDDFSDNRASLVICDSDVASCEEITVDEYTSNDCAGHGSRIGSRNGVAFNGKQIDANVTVNRAEGYGHFSLFEPGSAAEDMTIKAKLVDCGDSSHDAAVFTGPAGSTATLKGLHFDGSQIIRPGRRSLLCSDDVAVTDGTFDRLIIEDPNDAAVAALASHVLLQDVTGGSIRDVKIRRHAASGHQATNAILIQNGCSGLAVGGHEIDAAVYTSAAVLDQSTSPVRPSRYQGDVTLVSVTVTAGNPSGTGTVVAGSTILGIYPVSNQDQLVDSVLISGTTLTVTLAANATANNVFKVAVMAP